MVINPEAAVKSLIPHGMYCYEYRDDVYIKCPFWSRIPGRPDHENGYCSFLSRGDWDMAPGEGMGWLWDQVKECGINDDFDYEEVDTQTE